MESRSLWNTRTTLSLYKQPTIPTQTALPCCTILVNHLRMFQSLEGLTSKKKHLYEANKVAGQFESVIRNVSMPANVCAMATSHLNISTIQTLCLKKLQTKHLKRAFGLTYSNISRYHGKCGISLWVIGYIPRFELQSFQGC